MSNFQPINKARRTSKPAAENNSPAHDQESSLAHEACASNLMRASSSQAKPSKNKKRKSPKVVVSAKAPPQAMVSSEGSNNPQTPLRKKRKTMKETPKAPRERAPRDAKLVLTVEHSTTSTPAADAESDGDWSGSSERLEKLDSNMSSQTHHRRSPRHRPSSKFSAGFSSTGQCIGSSPSTRPQRSPLDEVSANAVKREGTVSRDRSIIRPRSMSPSDYNKKTRNRKLQAEGLVELPPAEWAYQRYKRTKKVCEKKIQAERRSWKKASRKQKGKEPERRLEGNAGNASEMPSKKRVKADRETVKGPKQQKESHKRAREEPIEVDADLEHVQNAASRSEHPSIDYRRNQSGKAAFSRKKAKVIIHEDSQPEAVVLQTTSDVLSSGCKRSAPKSSDKEVPPQRSTASGYIPTGPKSWRANQTQISRPWQQTCNRREVEVAASPGKCENLPAYFKPSDLLEPSLADFEGDKAEFLSHLRHVSDCKGHDQRLIDRCRFILIQEQGNEWGRAKSSSAPGGKENENGSGNAKGCSGDWLSSSRYAKPSRETNALYNRIGQRDKGLSFEQTPRGRQQSSIEPGSFYGKQPQYRVPPTFDSSPLPDKALTNENKDRDAERSERTTDRMTPPDSSPASKGSDKRRKSKGAHAPVESHAEDDWRPMFDDDEARPQPARSFNLQRRRHQSVPVKLGSRNTTVNQRDSSPRTEQRRDDALQELSKNSILTNKKLDSFRNEVREQLSAITLAQAAAVQPATTPTVAAAAADENRPAQFERRKRKRPSAAERQLDFPVLDHDVPMEHRLPDEDLIEIGRIVSGYERHRRAHYAFNWRGGLRRKNYKYLLDRNVNDGPVWTADEISRITR